MKKIAVIGLGYVGLPLAVEFGRLRQTVGFDINDIRIKELQNGFDKTFECSKEQLLKAKLLQFSSSTSDICDAQIYIITVPTPIDHANRPDLNPLKAASKLVGSLLKTGDIVIFESTVYPGATEEVCIPILQAESNLKFNKDFTCGYSPERINPGDKVNTLTTIKKVTSGSTLDAAIEIDALYKSIISAGTHLTSSIKIAEAAKVIENSQRDLNIAFVNELSMIFERLNIDTLEVLEAAGSKWNFLPFRPGMVGGHCIGVDPYYLTYKAEQFGYNPQVILSGRRINDNMAIYAAQSIIKRMLKLGVDVPRARVGILGVTFKENCPDIRNSKVFDLIEELHSWNANILVHDPWADKAEVKKHSDLDLLDLTDFTNLDALIVAVGHNVYREMSHGSLRKMCKPNASIVLGDLKSIYDRDELTEQGFDIFRL